MINYPDEYIDMLMEEFVKAPNGYDGFRAVLTKHELEHALVWDTTCPGCRRLMDRLYERDVEDGKI